MVRIIYRSQKKLKKSHVSITALLGKHYGDNLVLNKSIYTQYLSRHHKQK
jgi:hypothetical protein